jgi:hypothetical protein
VREALADAFHLERVSGERFQMRAAEASEIAFAGVLSLERGTASDRERAPLLAEAMDASAHTA